jgi:hypothetical protein
MTSETCLTVTLTRCLSVKSKMPKKSYKYKIVLFSTTFSRLSLSLSLRVFPIMINETNTFFVSAIARNIPYSLCAFLMASTNNLEHEKLIVAICSGSGKDEERSKCFSRMALNKKIQNTINDMKAKLWIPICQRGHEKLFKLFIPQFAITIEDISGGRGKILLHCPFFI